MKIWISIDYDRLVYTVCGTEPDYNALEIEAKTNPWVPMSHLEFDLPVDADTLARWEAAQTAWLQVQAEIDALLKARG